MNTIRTTNPITNGPAPVLFYQVVTIVSGTLAGAGVTITVDRDLPNFSGLSSDDLTHTSTAFGSTNNR